MKAWLKGGIIAGGIFILLLLIFSLIPSIGCNNKPLPEGEMWENCNPFKLSEILFLPSYPLLDILDIHNDFLAISIAFLFSFGVYFLIGSLIGLIIQKVRDKKFVKVNSQQKN